MKKFILFLYLLSISILSAESLNGIFFSRFRDTKNEVLCAFSELGYNEPESNLNYNIYNKGTYGYLPIDKITVRFICGQFYEFNVLFSDKADINDVNYLVEEILKKEFDLKYYNGTAPKKEYYEYLRENKPIPEQYFDETVIIFNKNSRELTVRDITLFKEMSEHGNKKDSFMDNIIYIRP